MKNNVQQNLERPSALREIKNTFKNREKETIIASAIIVLLSLFLSGLAYQYLNYMLRKVRHIYVGSSIKYGLTNWWALSLLLAVGMFYGFYRYIRMKPKHLIQTKTNYIRSETGTYGDAHYQTPEELEKDFDIYDKIAD